MTLRAFQMDVLAPGPKSDRSIDGWVGIGLGGEEDPSVDSRERLDHRSQRLNSCRCLLPSAPASDDVDKGHGLQVVLCVEAVFRRGSGLDDLHRLSAQRVASPSCKRAFVRRNSMLAIASVYRSARSSYTA